MADFSGTSQLAVKALEADSEVILPEQYFVHGGEDPRSEPARRLMLAVLEDALLTLGSHWRSRSRHARRIVAEVEVWFASNSRADPFAFGSICDVLGLDPAYIRDAIRGWKEQRTALTKYRRPRAGRGRAMLTRRG